ncbi:MAG: hypothetical protein PHT95_06295 [Candidatus Omnitrophica bacterium]|nr:hypothetical protein [Candidatus Omnitrophota bacterium]
MAFTMAVGAVFSADRLYSMSTAADTDKISAEEGIELIETAMKFTPGDARLYASKYRLMNKQAQNLRSVEESSVVSRQSSGGQGEDGPSKNEKRTTINDPRPTTLAKIASAIAAADASLPVLREKQLQVIARAIDLCPSSAKYHYYYARTMRLVTPAMTRMAVNYYRSQLQKASELSSAVSKSGN